MIGRAAASGRARWGGPPLLVQILALIVGALIVAQLVTLILTLVLPPEPPRRYELADIAATLRGHAPADARPLDRTTQDGPPDLTRGRWLVSARAREDLAAMLGVSPNRVVLGFYTALPVGAGQPGTDARLPLDATPAAGSSDATSRDVIGIAAAVPVWGLVQGPPAGGVPGGGAGRFPGGGFPGGQRGEPGGRPAGERRGEPRGAPQGEPRRAPSERAGQRDAERAGDRTGEPERDRGTPRNGDRGLPAGRQGPPDTAPRGGRVPIPLYPDPPMTIDPDPAPVSTTPARSIPLPPVDAAPISPPLRVVRTPAPRPAPIASPVASPAPARAPASRPFTTSATDVLRPASRPIPLDRPGTGLFGFAPAPFVEGDFVAAVRGGDGRWTVVAPRAEGFPNSWQRRVLLWFALSLLIVAPLAWSFAQRIVRPLKGFARAAETLGRDPAAAILPLDGPAEVGRAAHAFNLMQSRLRSFVDDRTAMVGAISHDLRTPLTRMRFRVEDVPEEQQGGLLDEILEMEAMITSVIAYIRDASTPNARERLDLATLVDDVVEDAVMIGADVRTVSAEPAPVDVDALGMRRVLDNLLANAVKYGGRARVALYVADACAIADIVDDGPGIPDDEIERVFEPFYRSEAARASTLEGSGLGLAVCRSIARAHGGDVALFRSPEGFVARVSLPLAYEAERRLVA